MTQVRKQLTVVWWVLVVLTLSSALIAERADPNVFIVTVICTAVAIKGSLVAEWLMGLRKTAGGPRWIILSYFILLPLVIALALTTLI